MPFCVTQTRDGYIRIVGNGEVFRFDGDNIVPWSVATKTRLSATAVYALHGARGGSLWIASASGPTHWNASALATLAASGVESIYEDSNGPIWYVEIPPLRISLR
jgi:hypothetical protein